MSCQFNLFALNFRSTNQQYSKGSQSRVNKSPVKSYDDFQDGERDNLKSANQVDIPHYVHNWSKHNPPYISSPTLVTGNLMGNNADCDWDTNKKPISRDRSLSVGNKEITCCDHDTSSATFVADGNTDNEYKTPAVWHKIWNNYTKPLNCSDIWYSTWSFLVKMPIFNEWSNKKRRIIEKNDISIRRISNVFITLLMVWCNGNSLLKRPLKNIVSEIQFGFQL